MINVVFNGIFEGSVSSEILEITALKVLEHEHKPEEVDVSIAIEDNAQLQELNLKFLGIDAPTDVLSFPANEIDPDTGHSYLGDIIISLPIAAAQAAAAGHPLQNELQLLVVHGMLHLLGYDHATPELKTEMWELQAQLLAGIIDRYQKIARGLMEKFLQSRWMSFSYAFNGIRYVLKTQENARIHAVISVAVIIMGIWLAITPQSWAIIGLTLGLVWMAECMNTAIETVFDLVNPDTHPLVKIGKDVSAAGVLISALCAVFVGLFIFGPPLFVKLFIH